jgi:hypothetical protein
MKTCSLLLITFLAARALQAADPVQFSVGNFAFDRPEGWTWIAPSSPMRKAQLSIPGSQGDAAADITFFHFGAGQGGGVQANVRRWFGQFQDGTTDTRNEKFGQIPVTLVSASGTFSSGMPGGPTTAKPGYALRGAILESAGGDVFVKMTGPESTVKAAEAAFEKMVKTAASR